MRSIFFDLETSDREPIGQILNFSFIVVSSDWRVEEELSGNIRLSRLQLPSPGAILANRINVLEHQKTAEFSERDGMRAIAEFLDRVISRSPGPIPLIGYNSFRFDIPYLRTSLIRNGINPYFGTSGKLQYRDLYAAARKLSVTNPKFPRVAAAGDKGTEGEAPRLSLKLETLAQQLKLLEGKQEHASRADVLLTIEVARVFKEKFGLDVRTYEAYEALACHQSTSRGRLFTMMDPQYDLSKEGIFDPVPVTLLDFDRKYSLWINLRRYEAKEGRRSIMYLKNQGSSFLIDATKPPTVEQEKVAKAAYEEFKSINLRNYFQKSSCDIELDIYRVDFDGIDALRAAIWDGKKEVIKNLNNRDLTALFVRHQLGNYTWGNNANDAEVRKRLKLYAAYRYGGDLVMSKYTDEGLEPRKHQTLEGLRADLEAAEKAGSPEDLILLKALKTYIQTSEIAGLLESRS